MNEALSTFGQVCLPARCTSDDQIGSFFVIIFPVQIFLEHSSKLEVKKAARVPQSTMLFF